MRDFSPRGFLCSLNCSAPVSLLHSASASGTPATATRPSVAIWQRDALRHQTGRNILLSPAAALHHLITFSFIPANCRTLNNCMHASSQGFLIFVDASILVMARARGKMLNTFLFPSRGLGPIYSQHFPLMNSFIHLFIYSFAAWGQPCICHSSMCKPSDPEQP